MKVEVTQINKSKTPWLSQFDATHEIATFDVLILMGSQFHEFKLAVDLDKIGDREIQIVRSDIGFEEIFKFDLALHKDICNLVACVYNHRPLKLPIDLGEFEKTELEVVNITKK